MQSNYSPSINIQRDSEKSLHYIPTRNSRNVYHQIASSFKAGIHSFNIIGSYGTGKSAFLLALKKHLEGEQDYFTPVNGHFNGCKSFEFFNLVGQSASFIEAVADYLQVKPEPKSILKRIEAKQSELSQTNACLVIVVDEFGKFLEYAASFDPDKELYFIQQLAELANEPEKNILFLTTLHQNFDAYAIGLKEAQRKEWEKVKGRLKELTFNEPVEQLLNLAADAIAATRKKALNKNTSPELLQVIKETGAFRLLNEATPKFINRLYPFDLLSAMALTIALQRYGQNERSLFNFLQSEEHLGLNSFQSSTESPFYSLDKVYDYLSYNFYSTLSSKYNPDYFKWALIRNSLERVEVELGHDEADLQKLLKTIGLLNILGSEASKITRSLLVQYGKECLGIAEPGKMIQLLEEQKIIHYQSFKERYKLFEGTDFDLEELQEKALQEVGAIGNLSTELIPYFKLDYVAAKGITYITGTPRIFKFRLTEEPILSFQPTKKEKETDGYVNLLFDYNPTIQEVWDEPILFGIFQKVEVFKEKLLQIKAIEKAITYVGHDKVALRELKEKLNNQVGQLNQLLNQELYGGEESLIWYFNGEKKVISSQKAFNKLLSSIMEEIYPGTPTFRNELMNKTKVSSSVGTARKNFTEALIYNWNKPNLGFDDSSMPPEKTIYLTLLKNTGIHKAKSKFLATFQPPSEDSFAQLWDTCEDFIDSTKQGKKPLTELIRLLSEKPFRLKEGFLEFWLISYLFIKREEYALFKGGRYIPVLTKEVAELLFKEAKHYEVKAFNIQGVKLDLFNKYRELTQQEEEQEISGSSFQSTAKPFLVFYKQLPFYTKNTQSLSHDAQTFRKVIKEAKELEKTFFEDLPSAYGFTVDQLSQSKSELQSFVSRVQGSIAELRSTYEGLVDRIESELLTILGYKNITFETYQRKIQERYAQIKSHLLFNRQKALLSRIRSQIPDRKAWINSIVQAVLGKQLNAISDEEEKILIDRLEVSIRELDDLTDLSQEKHDEQTESALKLEILGLGKGPIRRNFILAKEQDQASRKLGEKINQLLEESADEQVQYATLIRILQERLGEDE